MNQKLIVAVSVSAVVSSHLTGCTSYTTSLPIIDTKTADAERQTLHHQFITQFSNAKPIKQNIQYKQPTNKKEKCLLPEVDVIMQMSDLQVYWDGGCKNGFAHGFGREIIKSKVAHLEEITEHNHDLELSSSFESILWWRDYVNNQTSYLKINHLADGTTIQSGLKQGVNDNSSNFDIIEILGRQQNNEQWCQVSNLNNPFQTIVAYSNPLYRYENHFIDDPTSQFNRISGTLNNVTNNPIGIIAYTSTDGEVIFVFKNENVATTPDYWNDFDKQTQYTFECIKEAQQNGGRANELYRKYIYKACDDNASTNAIPKDLFKKICKYESQYTDKIQQVRNQNQQMLMQKQDQANTQRLIQAQEAQAQAAMMQSQIMQQNMIQNSIQNTINNIQNILPKQTNCLNIGMFTQCSTY